MNILESRMMNLAMTSNPILWMILAYLFNIKGSKSDWTNYFSSALANANIEICRVKLYVKVVCNLKDSRWLQMYFSGMLQACSVRKCGNVGILLLSQQRDSPDHTKVIFKYFFDCYIKWVSILSPLEFLLHTSDWENSKQAGWFLSVCLKFLTNLKLPLTLY